jgi:hypothetical protein
MPVFNDPALTDVVSVALPLATCRTACADTTSMRSFSPATTATCATTVGGMKMTTW